MMTRSEGAQFLKRWKVDEKGLSFRHRSTGMIVEILCNDHGWSAHVTKQGNTNLQQAERLAREVGQFFAMATGGAAQPGISKEIPSDWEWPLVGFDVTTGKISLRPGFVEELAKLFELPIEKLRPDMISGFLLSWYSSRQASGEPKDSLMEEVLQYHQRTARVKF